MQRTVFKMRRRRRGRDGLAVAGPLLVGCCAICFGSFASRVAGAEHGCEAPEVLNAVLSTRRSLPTHLPSSPVYSGVDWPRPLPLLRRTRSGELPKRVSSSILLAP